MIVAPIIQKALRAARMHGSACMVQVTEVMIPDSDWRRLADECATCACVPAGARTQPTTTITFEGVRILPTTPGLSHKPRG